MIYIIISLSGFIFKWIINRNRICKFSLRISLAKNIISSYWIGHFAADIRYGTIRIYYLSKYYWYIYIYKIYYLGSVVVNGDEKIWSL